MTSRASWAGLALAALLVVAGCGSSRAAASRVVSVEGSVGSLQMDRSSRGQVIAYAGRPDVDLHGSGQAARYEVLGYSCPHHVTPPRGDLLPCGTDFYLVGGKLGLFFTQEQPYSETHGVRIGMPTVRAERLLRRKVFVGCEANVGLYSKSARLTIAFTGRKTRELGPGRMLLVSGNVVAFYLHSDDRDPGVTDCS